MKPAFSPRPRALPIFVALLATFVAPVLTFAQSAGNNAVYGGGLSPISSGAFIDASLLTSPNSDANVCAKINDALSIAPPSGAVIDARGVNGLTCPPHDTPWSYGGHAYSTPAVILLPSGTINISTGWVVPGHTRVIGGPDATANGTLILANSAYDTSGPMVQFCSGTSNCAAVGLENLFLNGQDLPVTEIENDYAADSMSYVDHVNLSHIGSTSIPGIGLKITASGSGTYSNIQCIDVSNGGTCVELMASNTGGLHGLTCTNPNENGAAAIRLDGSNNTIEDVHMEGFSFGIVVGGSAPAEGNTLSNINGSSGTGSMQDVIDISNFYTVSDLTILGATSLSNNGNQVTTLLDDTVTSTVIPNGSGPAGEASLAKYVLGEQDANTLGYVRFTTAPVASGSASIATFAAGSTGPGLSCTGNNGSIYVNTTGKAGGMDTLYVCAGGSWAPVK